MTNIYVGNLSFRATEDDLRNAFSAHGEVSSVNIIMDRETGRSRGFAFVEMPNSDQANSAIEALNGEEIAGRGVTVNEARDLEPTGLAAVVAEGVTAKIAAHVAVLAAATREINCPTVWVARSVFGSSSCSPNPSRLHSGPAVAFSQERRRTKCNRMVWLAGLLLCAGPLAADDVSPPQPNVLFLAVDDMKDWVNCLGGYAGTVHTPNMDRLARRGVLFRSAHCASPKCAPSRAAIMTGLRPSTTGLYENGHWWAPNLPDVVTIPMHFCNHGYHVIGAGKIFHHTAGNNPPGQWDDFLRLTFRNDPWFRSVKLNYPWSASAEPPAQFPFSRVQGLGHENDWGSLEIPDADYDDALSVDYAVDALAEAHARPLFLACGVFRPHLPWYVPQRFFDLYPLEEIRLPEQFEDDLNDIPAEGLKLAEAGRRDLEVIREAGRLTHAVQAYLASISFADEQLGRILDALDASRYADDTIVMLWSDHGWHLGEKQHWHKSTLWEEATRVPLLISVPGVSPGVCERPVSLLDLYPTLLDLCHLPALDPIADRKLDGVSLLPLLRDPQAEWNRPAVTEYLHGNAAVRSERYRYIRYRDGAEELYDHASDPHEWHNLATAPELAELKAHLAEWLPPAWAESAPTKSAFAFDPETYTWEPRDGRSPGTKK